MEPFLAGLAETVGEVGDKTLQLEREVKRLAKAKMVQPPPQSSSVEPRVPQDPEEPFIPLSTTPGVGSSSQPTTRGKEGVVPKVEVAKASTKPKSKLRLEPEEVPENAEGFGPSLVGGVGVLNLGGGGGSSLTKVFPVQATPTHNPWMSTVAQPLLVELMKSARQPKFSGKPADWVEFTIEWDKYWAKVSAKQETDEVTKMQLFEDCLDPTSTLDIESRRRQGEVVTYTRYYTYLNTKFGRVCHSQLRQKLQQLELRREGRSVTLGEWRAFVVAFNRLVFEAKVTEDEAYERLLEKIGGLRNWVVEKELKEERKTPTVEILFPMAISREDVLEFLVEAIGGPPKMLIMEGNSKCRVVYDDKKLAEKVVCLNERRLEGMGGRKIRAAAVEARMTLQDAINHISQKLEDEERKIMKLGHPKEQRRTWVIVGTEQAKEPQPASVQEVKAEEIRKASPAKRDSPPTGRPSTPPTWNGSSRDNTPRNEGKGSWHGRSWETQSQGRGYPTPSRTPDYFPVGSRKHTNSLEYECLYGDACQDPICRRWHPQQGKGATHISPQQALNGAKGKGKGKGESSFGWGNDSNGKGKDVGKGKGKGEGKGSGKGGFSQPNVTSPPVPTTTPEGKGGGGKGERAEPSQ